MTLSLRQKRILLCWVFLIVGAAAVGAANGLLITFSSHRLSLAITIPLLALLCAAGCAVAIPLWMKLDDRQREAQLVSWYWGGLYGLAFGVMAAMAIGGVQPGRWSPMMQGAGLVLAVQMLCYFRARLQRGPIQPPRAAGKTGCARSARRAASARANWRT